MNTMTEIIATVENTADGIAADVAKIATGYAVALRDLDSGEVLDTVRIFPTQAQALVYAQQIAG